MVHAALTKEANLHNDQEAVNDFGLYKVLIIWDIWALSLREDIYPTTSKAMDFQGRRIKRM